MTAHPPPLSARGPILSGFVMIAVLIFGFGVWSVLARISGAIVAPGQVQVAQNRQVVQHPDGGVIETIAITEGQTVQAGDLLVRLDGSLLKSELAIVEAQLFELQARRARLEAEQNDAPRMFPPPDLLMAAQSRPDVAKLLDGQQKLFTMRAETQTRQTDQLHRRAALMASQIKGIDAQSAATREQLRLIRAELTDQRDLLARGLTQSHRVLSLEREEAHLIGLASELAANRAAAEGNQTEIALEILRLAAARREEASQHLRDIAAPELELVERRHSLRDRIKRLDIRAPVSGLVLGLQATTPHAVLRPADPVLFLIPQDRPLVIQAQIPTPHIDAVYVGQRVRLIFPAFSARTSPDLLGTVALISADALTQESTGQSFYRAEIVLDPAEQERTQSLPLRPGMPVQAFIQTADRSPLAYLLQPFTDYFTHAFRET